MLLLWRLRWLRLLLRHHRRRRWCGCRLLRSASCCIGPILVKRVGVLRSDRCRRCRRGRMLRFRRWSSRRVGVRSSSGRFLCWALRKCSIKKKKKPKGTKEERGKENNEGQGGNIPSEYLSCLSSWVRPYEPAGESGARPFEEMQVYGRHWGLSLGVPEEAALHPVPVEFLSEADWRAMVPWAGPEDRLAEANCHWEHGWPHRQEPPGPFAQR